jgi:transcriptional regulator with XRE-family HTH domain
MSDQDQPWKIGALVTRFREDSRMSLRQLSERTKEIERQDDLTANGLQTAQLSRIERGLAVPDLREIVLLSRALGKSPQEFLPGMQTPWYAVRKENALRWLEEVKAKTREIRRVSHSHQQMIDDEVYVYVPLTDQPGLVEPGERSGQLSQIMQKYLFEVRGCTLETIEKGLYAHAGEEIVWVLEGELEFWTQEGGEKPRFITLGEGDSLHYSSNVKHGYRAGGKDKIARALFVYTNIASPPMEITTPRITEGGEPNETSS